MNGEIDPVIHPVNRLRICVGLQAAGATEGGEGPDREMKFSVLRDLTGLSDVTLSKQLGVLESHGYITRHREYGSKRAEDSVWVSLSAVGVRQLAGHMAALREIVEWVDR
ncbi:MAG TPA: transcriptional regulator [Candidatus Dietzia merdigallinarum]|nr:transcriptional regulator [Candidatus Dietzia merdigallinarum]